MKAIINFKNNQILFIKNPTIVNINKIKGIKKGSSIEIEKDKILLLDSKSNLKKIRFKVQLIENIKQKKKIIFKRKRRKGFLLKKGYRSIFSKIKITYFKI
jgi:large subunit ribosomal protein L21